MSRGISEPARTRSSSPHSLDRAAIGVAIDNRGRLFVAGGPTGDGYVYDAKTGANVADYNFTDDATFVNDVVVTRTAAWFTDSVNPVLYKVLIAPDGTLGSAITVPYDGDIDYQPGFNVNGIDATPNGKTLIIVQSNTGKLFTVDRDGVTNEIEGATVGGDGLLLDGKTLYAVTRSPSDQIVVIKLAPDLRRGRSWARSPARTSPGRRRSTSTATACMPSTLASACRRRPIRPTG